MTTKDNYPEIPQLKKFNLVANIDFKNEVDSFDGKTVYYPLNDNSGNKIGCLLRKIETQQYIGSQTNLVNDVYNLYQYKSVLSFVTNVDGNIGNARNNLPNYRTGHIEGPLAAAGFNNAIVYSKNNNDTKGVVVSITLQKNEVKDLKQLPVFINPLTIKQSVDGKSIYTPFFADKALTTKIGCVETDLERISFPANGLTYFTNDNIYHFYQNASDYGFPVGDFVTKRASDGDSQLSIISNLEEVNADQTNNGFVGYEIKILTQAPDPSSGSFSQLISFGKSYDKSPDVSIEGYFDNEDFVDSITNPSNIKKITIWADEKRTTQLGVAQFRQVTNVYSDGEYTDYQLILEINKGSGLGRIVVNFTSNETTVALQRYLLNLKAGSSSLGDSINSTWTNAEVTIVRSNFTKSPFEGIITILGYA